MARQWRQVSECSVMRRGAAAARALRRGWRVCLACDARGEWSARKARSDACAGRVQARRVRAEECEARIDALIIFSIWDMLITMPLLPIFHAHIDYALFFRFISIAAIFRFFR